MNDVAARAGVSHQTVSRVLNNHPSVRDETRARVLQVIAELGYRRNEAARALVTNHTRTVGLLRSDSVHLGTTEMVRKIEAELRHQGFYMALATFDQPTAAAAAESLDHLLAQGVEGVIAFALTDAVAALFDTHNLPCPVVVISSREEFPRGRAATYVSVDQYAGAVLATQHLLAAGCRSLVHLAGPDHWFDAAARRRGFEDTVAAASAPAKVIEVGAWTARAGYEAGRRLTASVRDGLRAASAATGPIGVFAANDMLAIGAMRAFAEAGLRVPEDLAVVGFDDTEVSGYLPTPLTSIWEPFQEVGALAVDHLLRRMGHDSPSDSPPNSPGERGQQAPRLALPILQARASSSLA